MTSNAWYEHCGLWGANPDVSVLLQWTQFTVSWQNIVPANAQEETDGQKVSFEIRTDTDFRT